MPPTFAQLGVPEPISRSLAAHGITEPFAIQAATIADALAGARGSPAAYIATGQGVGDGCRLDCERDSDSVGR